MNDNNRWHDKDKFFDKGTKFSVGYLLAAFCPPILAVLVIGWIIKSLFSRSDY